MLADPNINVTILVLGPDRFDSKFLEALRKVITTGAPGARFMVSPLRKQGRNTRAKKTGPQPARLLTWRFDHSFLKSGTQLRVFKKQLMNLSRGTIRPFLQVHLAMDSFPRQQQAIFAVMDTVLEIQNNISGFDLRIHVGSLIGPDGRELNWETQQMRIANVEDVIKTLLWAEFDNRALVPKRARRCSDDVYASGVSLRARQPTEVESCFPLDEISTLEPPLSRHHLRFGRDFQDMIIDEFEAEKRPHKFLFFGNGPFVVGSTPRHATARSILRTFQRWRPLKSYLKVFRNSEDQKKMLSVLDLLVRNEILEVRRPLQRRRKISAPSKHGCIHFVGVGPGEEGAMSIGAAAALDGAEEIWMQDLGPPGFERAFLRRWIYNAPKVVNLSSFYDIAEASRSLFYNITPRRILHLAQQGRSITFAFSGNPEVWVYLTEVVKQHTLHQRVALKLTHSMSFIDIMYEATPLSFPDKVQVRLGGVTAPDISPNMDCILGQLGDRGKTGFHSATKQLVEDLQRFFPDDHPIFLSGNHAISGTQKSLQISVKELAAVALKFNQWNFSALIPSLSRGRLVQKLFAEGNPDNSMVFF
ncbi:MAG TPA: hypothetical protein VI895_13760 [Bdellovibrionota bacterium]|nr:hypothetical protein [Bdellovibrionota bacterium]